VPTTIAPSKHHKRETGANTKKFEELLLRERASLADERTRLRSRASDKGVSMPYEDGGDVDEGTVDLSNYLMAKEIDASVEESLEDTLHGIDLALRKIQKGTYGTCDICQKRIPKARLEAIPHATLCMNCQSLVEEF